MLSILIPVYNYCVVPLVKQLVIELGALDMTAEIIVLDDASTDKSLVKKNEILSEIATVQYIALAENKGRSGARNLLAKKAAYDWLLFLDADVKPLQKSFISQYLKHIAKDDNDVICGGLSYETITPKHTKLLRYVYGKNREQQTAFSRNKYPYFITAGNFMIKKDLFLKVNTKLENFYGDDLLLSQNLKNQNASILHIDAPVVHFGLETSREFLDKSILAVQSIVTLEREGLMDSNFSRLQQAYLKLKKYKSLQPFLATIKLNKKSIKKNLLSKKPSLRLFDAYRLYHYAKLKAGKDA